MLQKKRTTAVVRCTAVLHRWLAHCSPKTLRLHVHISVFYVDYVSRQCCCCSSLQAMLLLPHYISRSRGCDSIVLAQG